MLRGRKLLLADDSLAIQKVIELTFEDEGMQVVSVANGQQAVERLEEVRPDIVLADVFMPELNGYEVCERIKRDERFRHIPVVLLVGSFEPFNEAEARRVGADDYLTKPFQSIRQMVSKVGSLLSGHKGEADAATQELPSPPEHAGAESQARRDNLELTTADTAPLPQHMRREAFEDETAATTPKGPFADLQLDDEMIEETRASEFGSGGQTAGTASSSHQRPTQPVSAQELAEMGVKTAATSAPGQPLTTGGSPASAQTEPAREVAVAPASSAAPSPRDTTRATANEDALLDLDDVEMPRSGAMAEADDFILDLQDAAEARPQEAPAAENVFSTFENETTSATGNEALVSEAVVEAELVEEMTAAEPQAAEFTAAQVVGEEQRAAFDAAAEQPPHAEEPASYRQGGATATHAVEVEPLMMTAPDTSQMQETQELPSESQLTSGEQLPENFQSDATRAQTESASLHAAAVPASEPQQQSPAGQIGLEQLSPEAIEAIARRVVEQLSTKVVEQIAWEVVPPLAELLIKRRLEEEGKQ